MDERLLTTLGCPRCGGSLAFDSLDPGGGVGTSGFVGCDPCDASYPVLSGVPILVADPPSYLAEYRESVLASLAEHGRASQAAVELVQQVASFAAGTTPARFGDDWVDHETRADGAPPSPLAEGAGGAALAALVDSARRSGPASVLVRWLANAPEGRVLELGCGAGAFSRVVARTRELVLTDISLRAVLVARATLDGARVTAAVADATRPPVPSGSVNAVLAMNVVDLVPDTEELLSAVAEVLPPAGELWLGTPDPSLGMPGAAAETLDGLVEDAGFVVAEATDGVPWLRRHGPRHVETYLVRMVRAVKP